jgi:hypothetical protein
VAALQRQRPIEMAKAGEYRVQATTWLRQERWKDEAEAPKNGDVGRSIGCPDCADTGIAEVEGRSGHYRRCSCNRGQLPGLVIPQAEETQF